MNTQNKRDKAEKSENSPEAIAKQTEDIQKLDELRQQLSPEIVSALLLQGQESMQERLLELRQAVQDGNGQQIRETAHAIKGTSGSLYASSLSELAATIEKNAFDLPAVTDVMETFEEAIADAIKWWQHEAG